MRRLCLLGMKGTQHHEPISKLLTALEELCKDEHPGMEKVSQVRLALSRASRSRSAYLNSVVYPRVVRTCPPDKRIALEKLKSDGVLMLVRSGDHIRHWTARQIAADWAGYRQASAAVRRSMRDRVELEARLLYPLLKGKAAPLAADGAGAKRNTF